MKNWNLKDYALLSGVVLPWFFFMWIIGLCMGVF